MVRLKIWWNWRLTRARETFWIKLAWAAPKSLAYWCAIRVGAHATQGQYSGQLVPDLTVADALKRWQ